MDSLSLIIDIIRSLIDPFLFMTFSIRKIPLTVYQILTSSQPWLLLSPSYFEETLFGNFWAEIGPQVKQRAEERVIPLLEGRVKDGRVFDQVVSSPVYGTVMEVGAGSGMWADVFQKIATAPSYAAVAAAGTTSASLEDGEQLSGSNLDSPARNLRSRKNNETGKASTTAVAAGTDGDQQGITKIYGVEPNPTSATALQQRVKTLGLDDVYEVVPVGIEDVTNPMKWQGEIPPESIDCVVCILCLCSIPDQEKNIAYLYRLLKPGGKWFFYEHVQCTRGGPAMRLYQRFVNCIWPLFLGSCRLCRNTGKTLREVGPWSEMDIAEPVDTPCYAVLPHIIGTLTK